MTDNRYMSMEEMVEESGISRFTLMPALQTKQLHGGQRVPRGKWRAERVCFEAWMRGDDCPHRESAESAEAAKDAKQSGAKAA